MIAAAKEVIVYSIPTSLILEDIFQSGMVSRRFRVVEEPFEKTGTCRRFRVREENFRERRERRRIFGEDRHM